MTLAELRQKIRDHIQEYSTHLLTDSLLNNMINDAIKLIACDTLVFKKLSTEVITDTDAVSTPADMFSIENLKLDNDTIVKVNYEDLEYLENSSNPYYYIIGTTIKFDRNVSGTVNILYNYIPSELTLDADKIDTLFNGFESIIVYLVASEFYGTIEGDLQKQGFTYRIYENRRNRFMELRSISDSGRAMWKYPNKKRFAFDD